jgi:cytochrome c553
MVTRWTQCVGMMSAKTVLTNRVQLVRMASAALSISVVLTVGSIDARTPDIELGRYLATECMTCHRSAAASSTIPNIFGIAEQTFTQVMNAYRAKQLPNPVMQNIAGRLNDDEIEALAAFFARTKRP